MSKTKSYNQIIFLTTLSVYLGLVLVGASPQVLAQAALTSKFEIKDQIEKKDDLDKKPNENDLIADSIFGIVNDLNKFSKSKKFSWEEKTTFLTEDLGFCKSDDSPAYGGSHSNNTSFKIGEFVDKYNVQIGRNLNKLRVDFGLGDFYSGYPEGITFNLSTEKKSLALEIKVGIKNDEISQQFYNILNTYVSQKKSSAKSSKQLVIYQNTTVTAENNQVFIVTRLPRAAIDSLIKQ
jgi:hypothetical protein